MLYPWLYLLAQIMRGRVKEIDGSKIGNLDLDIFFWSTPLIGSPFYHQIFWHKIPVFWQNEYILRRSVRHICKFQQFFLDSLQLILAITPHIPHCTISCKIINDFIDPLSSSDTVNFLTILFQWTMLHFDLIHLSWLKQPLCEYLQNFQYLWKL